MSSTINASTASGGGVITTADASGVLQLQSGGTTALTIDASQNVGIGTSSPIGKLHVSGGRSFFGANSELYSICVAYSPARTAVGQGYYLGASDAASPDLVFSNSSGVEKVRIDATGNVGIGTSSPNAKLDVVGTINSSVSLTAGNATTSVNPLLISSGQTGTTVRSNSVARFQTLATGRDVYVQFSDNVTNATEIGMISGATYFCTGSTERMRIDSTGNLLVGTTSVGAAGGITMRPNLGGAGTYARITLNHSVVTSSDVFSFEYLGTQVGRINVGTTATSYVTTSDQRLKENIIDAPSALASVNAIKVRSFDWKSSGEHQEYGYIAQELLEVAPEAVSVPTDEDQMMGVDFGKLTPRLVKAIQELKTIIDTQSARIEALEAK
jgi:hypothetical protein